MSLIFRPFSIPVYVKVTPPSFLDSITKINYQLAFLRQEIDQSMLTQGSHIRHSLNLRSTLNHISLMW